MRELSTIQKREKLNEVWTVDETGNGGANHGYIICKTNEHQWQNGNNTLGIVGEVQFQNGPRKDEFAMHGVLDTDLLEIVRDRLKGFQSGPFACRENAIVLTHIEEALMWMNRRVEDRIERNVLGTNQK